jgi:hypothetical protein
MGSVSLKNKSKLGNLTAPGDVDLGAMIPIATSTVGAGGVATVTFSDIPQNYEHLQIRFVSRNTRGSTTVDAIGIRANADSANNYANHRIYGAGANIVSTGETTVNRITIGHVPASTGAGANRFGSGIIDVLDYKNTNKNKTIRSLGGYDDSGESYGMVGLYSGVWLSTTAITSLTMVSTDGTGFSQYSSFALYGIKRAGA